MMMMMFMIVMNGCSNTAMVTMLVSSFDRAFSVRAVTAGLSIPAIEFALVSLYRRDQPLDNSVTDVAYVYFLQFAVFGRKGSCV